jgi:hypothetical protein
MINVKKLLEISPSQNKTQLRNFYSCLSCICYSLLSLLLQERPIWKKIPIFFISWEALD